MPRKRKDPPAAIALAVAEVADGEGDLGLPVAVALDVLHVAEQLLATPRANVPQAMQQAGGGGGSGGRSRGTEAGTKRELDQRRALGECAGASNLQLDRCSLYRCCMCSPVLCSQAACRAIHGAKEQVAAEREEGSRAIGCAYLSNLASVGSADGCAGCVCAALLGQCGITALPEQAIDWYACACALASRTS